MSDELWGINLQEWAVVALGVAVVLLVVGVIVQEVRRGLAVWSEPSPAGAEELEITGRKPVFYGLGLFVARRRWWVIIAWIAATVAVGPQLAKLADRLSQGGFEVPGSQSDRVRIVKENEFKSQFEFTDLVVFHSDELTAKDIEFRATIRRVATALAKAPGVAEVSDPYQQPDRSISPDGHTVIATAGLSDTQDEALKNADAVDRAAQKAAGDSPVEVRLTGGPPFYSAFSKTTVHDLEKAERIALPITLLILLLVFGSLVAAGMPLAMALLSLAVSFGLISYLASMTTVSLFTQNIASMIGIGVGIDYSLFILNRYREELRAGREVPHAIAESLATSGKAVFFSALTVVVALSGTTLVNLAAFRSMGFGAMIAVGVAGIAALTLLPALLSLVGHKIDSLRIRRRRPEATSGWWHRWATGVMRHPWIALGISAAIIVFLALPARNLRLGSSGPTILPPDSDPRVALEQTGEAFGEGATGPIQVLLEDGDMTGTGFAEVYRVAGEIAKDSEVVRVDSIATLVPGAGIGEARGALSSPELAPFAKPLVSTEGDATLVSVVTKHGPQSKEAGDLVERLRERLPQVAGPSVDVAVGGDPGLNKDIDTEVRTKLPWVVAMVLALSYLLLLVFLRSVLLPLKAILMNLASVIAAYGLLVFVFQEGNGEDILSFVSPGHIESFLPLFLFSILFGLSMDYEVFLLARIKEEYLRTGNNTEAVGWGLEHTAKIITSAAAIMVTVFGAFAFASLVPIKEMGFGLAVAVLLDATIIRIVMVPATMRLMGNWNWWLPKWLDRALPKVSLETSAPAPAMATLPTPGL